MDPPTTGYSHGTNDGVQHPGPGELRRVLALLTALLLASSPTGLARAQSPVTANMQVSLAVQATCSLAVNDLAFGTVAGDAASANTQADLTTNCSTSLSYRVSIDAGQHLDSGTRRVADADGNTINYMLYQDSARTVEWGDADVAATYANGNALTSTGTGADQTHTVYATATDINGRPGGDYSDTTTITVTF